MTAPSAFLLGLIGSGIATSFSPELHHREADRHALRLVYRILDIDGRGSPTGATHSLLRAARAAGFDGLNVTHPSKMMVHPYLDELSPDAEALGSVNTIVFKRGRAVGHNTDVTGFAASFTRGLPGVPLGRVVQLGAGGAGRAVAHALLRLGTGHLMLVDTQPERAQTLVDNLERTFGPGRAAVAALEGLAAALVEADGLVNATPIGMTGHPGTPVPETLLHSRLWVADIVYRPMETALLRAAAGAGCRTLSGGGMVALQAAGAFELFTGLQPHTAEMLADLTDLASAQEK